MGIGADPNNESFEEDFQEIPEDVEYELHLTAEEVLFIDDSLSLLVNRDEQLSMMPLRGQIPKSVMGAPIDLVSKMGMAVLQVTEPSFTGKDLVTVEVSAMELLILRELASSSIIMGASPQEHKFVGLSLKRKIYNQLFGEQYKEIKALDLMHNQLRESDPELVKFLDNEENDA